MRGHELVGVEREGGDVHEAVAGPHLGHPFAERLLEPGDERLGLLLGEGALGGRLRPVLQLHVGVVGGEQALAVELADVRHHVFVNVLVAEEHFEVAGAEALEIGPASMASRFGPTR